MMANGVEYRHQFWIALAIYGAAFAWWPLDRRDVAGFLTRLLPQTALGNGLGFLIAALLVATAAGLATWSYAHFGHPGYLGVWLCWAGFGLLLNRAGLVVVVIGVGALAYRHMRRGEAELTTRSQSDWPGALQHGAPMWIAAGALVSLALTRRESLFYGILCGAFVARIAVSVRRVTRIEKS